jgi:hypothetical protein
MAKLVNFMFGSRDLNKTEIIERYIWLGYYVFSLSIVFALIFISRELPPMMIKDWVVIVIQVLLTIIAVRLLIYLVLYSCGVFKGYATGHGGSRYENLWITLPRLGHFAAVAFLFLATLWVRPLWLHPWKWTILQTLTFFLVLLSFLSFLLGVMTWRARLGGKLPR